MFVDQILNRIRLFRRHGGYSVLGFANLTGASETALRVIDTNEWNPTVSTIRKCEAVIPPEFMSNANDDNQTSSDLQATPVDRGEDQTEAA